MRYSWLILLLSVTAFATPISLSLKNAPSQPVLRYLAEETEQNIILNENIQDQLNLRLVNKEFDQILKSVASMNQWQVKQKDNIYYVEKFNSSNQGMSSQNQDGEMINKPILLQIKSVKLHYAKASEVIDAITKGNGNLLSENGYLHFDERSNSIIIKDTPNSIKHLTNLIKQLDHPTEQIAIEARIVTISSENLKELGVRWGMFSPSEGHHRFSGNLEGNGLLTNNLNVNFPVSNAASAVLQIATINSRMLDLELSALEQENSVEIIASPRLLTTNKKPASIKQGTEIPYAIYDKKSDGVDVQFKEAVLGLEVTPQLSHNQQILLDLIVTQNAPANQNGVNSLTTIDKQELKTQVFAKNGETIVLGGVFQHLVAKGEDKVPILGSIPVIKHLFSQSRDKISKRELIIFVTPRVIKQAPLPSSSDKTSKKIKQK